MAFTNNRNVFYNNKSFDEKLFANGLGMGTPSFVCKGLELTGTTLTSGVFNNTGAFGILGLEGETHTIPANYTGFLVIKTTMNSQNGFNEIITSATKLDTDQRDTSNIKYFTIYQLNNGTIVQDFRHINYVKSFYLKNMGGSNIAWVLNGFTSDTFDASVLAGNRTLLNNVDIAYDDTIHGASTYDNILLDLFTKGQTNVGNDKPFILNFVIKKDVVMTNLATSTINFIFNEHGYVIDPIKEINFKMECTTSVGDLNDESHDFANVVSVWGDGFYFEYVFDYDDFANVVVYRIKRTRGTGVINLWSGPATNTSPIILTKSIFDMGFDFLRVTTTGSQIKVDGFTRNMVPYRGVTSARISGGDVEHIFSCEISTDGVTLTPRGANYTYSKTLQTPSTITIDGTLSVTQIDGGWYD